MMAYFFQVSSFVGRTTTASFMIPRANGLEDENTEDPLGRFLKASRMLERDVRVLKVRNEEGKCEPACT